jgi:hypothetical protein
MGQLGQAVEGRMQSVHLEHLLQEDWGELLIPRASAIAQSCSCDEAEGCEHVAAVAYAFADERNRTHPARPPPLARRRRPSGAGGRGRRRPVARQGAEPTRRGAPDADVRSPEAPWFQRPVCRWRWDLTDVLRAAYECGTRCCCRRSNFDQTCCTGAEGGTRR